MYTFHVRGMMVELDVGKSKAYLIHNFITTY